MTEASAALERVELPVEAVGIEPHPPLLGHNLTFCRLRESVDRVAAGDAPVLLRGEPGSGRALMARVIHRASSRAHGPFVVVSCSGNPETLLETELFGCVKGAVVGASCDRHGVLDMAHGGSVFLEDIDEMSPRTQRLLIRFLETAEVHKVGLLGAGTPADVRLLASSRLETAGADAALHPDLQVHFQSADLTVPPLRERRDDIPVLANYFARETAHRLGLAVASFTPQAHSALEAYSWPGNVGELKQVVERLAAEAPFQDVRAEDLPVGIRPRRAAALRAARSRRSVADHLYARLTASGESFWTCVYPLFMRREITRMDVRDLVRRGLEAARGNRDTLVRLFNMPPSDQGKFERFLRKYDCQLG